MKCKQVKGKSQFAFIHHHCFTLPSFITAVATHWQFTSSGFFHQQRTTSCVYYSVPCKQILAVSNFTATVAAAFRNRATHAVLREFFSPIEKKSDESADFGIRSKLILFLLNAPHLQYVSENRKKCIVQHPIAAPKTRLATNVTSEERKQRKKSQSAVTCCC